MKYGKVLITGGTGSLGQAILRKAKDENWESRFTILSRDENKQAHVRSLYPEHRYILGDVRDLDKLEIAFREHDLVIHAAAYKRVPSAQVHTEETIKTNIIGSRNVAYAAIKAGVSRVIGVSTDKAAKPVNAYGASKMLMEASFQEANRLSSETKFTLTRYGNVIGSNGSVIPHFKWQHKNGGPLTVTDYNMTRFWITLDTAVELLIAASELQVPGIIVVPKAPALGVLKLAELIADGMNIEEIGIRPGEKMHEVLITEEEALYTEEVGNYYYIHPSTENFHGKMSKGFFYSSDTASTISDNKMLTMIEEWETLYE